MTTIQSAIRHLPRRSAEIICSRSESRLSGSAWGICLGDMGTERILGP